MSHSKNSLVLGPSLFQIENNCIRLLFLTLYSCPLNQIQSLFDLQLAQITDLRQAQASLTATEAEQLRLQAEFAIAEEFLRNVTGIDVGRLFVLNPEVDLPETENSSQYWVELARENSFQIEARRNAVRAAEESRPASFGTQR